MKPAHATSALAIAITACTSAPKIEAPQHLRPAAGETPAIVVAARGVQVYECRARKEGTGFEWTFVAPEAELFDAHTRSIGHHGAGPFWEARDGSRVIGTVQARADAPEPGAVPWLLLTTKSVGPAGTFSDVTSIQRVNTAGGVAPVAECGGNWTEGCHGACSVHRGLRSLHGALNREEHDEQRFAFLAIRRARDCDSRGDQHDRRVRKDRRLSNRPSHPPVRVRRPRGCSR